MGERPGYVPEEAKEFKKKRFPFREHLKAAVAAAGIILGTEKAVADEPEPTLASSVMVEKGEEREKIYDELRSSLVDLMTEEKEAREKLREALSQDYGPEESQKIMTKFDEDLKATPQISSGKVSNTQTLLEIYLKTYRKHK